jgi:hypothetical protein
MTTYPRNSAKAVKSNVNRQHLPETRDIGWATTSRGLVELHRDTAKPAIGAIGAP